MGDAASDRAYWFDAVPLIASSSGWNPFAKLNSFLPGRSLSEAHHDTLAAFAEANGLGYMSWIERSERATPLPSLVLNGTCEAIIVDNDSPYLEIGNHGWRYALGDIGGAPSRRGYVAIRHDLDLPHTYLNSLATGPSIISMVVQTAGLFDAERSEWDSTAVEAFNRKSVRLKALPRAFGFTANTKSGDETEVMAMLSGPAQPLFSEIAAAFDVELRGEWLCAYSRFGELSTLDPQTWAWAFATASRMIDALALCGAHISNAYERSWYTTDRVDRPAKPGSLAKKVRHREK